jgi:hypothetical protein
MGKKNSKRQRAEETAQTSDGDKKPKASKSEKPRASKSDNPDQVNKKSGLTDIDDLFASKKKRAADEKKTQQEEERIDAEKRKFFQQNYAGPTTANAKKMALSGDKTDVAGLETSDWVDDGRGGVFDMEGFTGRKEEGVKVFKAHLFNKKGFGTTKDCPFDCDCCFI